MISIIYADIGTGKTCLLSYLAARAVQGKSINVKGLKFGTENAYQYVYTNFPAYGCYQLYYDDIGETDMAWSLLLLDEAQLEADSRNYKNFSDNKKMFFSLHRHMHCDVVIATQEASMVDKRIRDLAVKQYELTSGIFNTIRLRQLEKTRNPKTQDCEFAYSGAFYNRHFYRPRLYKYTDSHYMYDVKFRPRVLVPWFEESGGKIQLVSTNQEEQKEGGTPPSDKNQEKAAV